MNRPLKGILNRNIRAWAMRWRIEMARRDKASAMVCITAAMVLNDFRKAANLQLN